MEAITPNHLAALVLGGYLVAMFAMHLVLKVEKRVGGSGKFTGYLALALFFGTLAFFYFDGVMTSDRAAQIIRQQLRLPDDVALSSIQGGNKVPVCFRKSVKYRTSAKFSDVQFKDYLASLENHGLWRPQPPAHYDVEHTTFRFAEDALQWRELPVPGFIGKQQLVWRIANADVRRGWSLCYDLIRDTRASTPAVEHFTVTACDARTRKAISPGGGRVAAALDFDKRRLNIAMHFDSKAHYCRHRVTDAVNRLLGSSPRPSSD